MHRARRAIGHAVCLLTLIASGCVPGTKTGSNGNWEAAIDTIGDTIRVRTMAGSVRGGLTNLEPEITVGLLEGQEEYLIGEPQSIAVDSKGVIYLLDAHGPVIRAYGPDGVHIRDIGRDGEGPGEYSSPDGIAVLGNGRLLVRDPPNARITVFDSLGTLVEEWPLSGGFNTSIRLFVDHADNSYATTLLERGVDPWDWRFGVIRYTPQGAIADTVPTPIWDYRPAQVTATGDGWQTVRAVPYTPEPVWTFSPLGYMVGGLPTEYRIDLFLPDGSVRRIERDFTPVPVAGEEADEWRAAITEGLRGRAGLWTWNGPPIPDEKPPFKEMFCSWEGDIWVSLSTEGVATMTLAEAREEEAQTGNPPRRFMEPLAFDVFDRDGRYLGPVNPPEGFQIEPEPIVRGDHIWAVTRDELDVPRIVRFRIVLEEGG
jgi:hypothetical protein